MNKKINSNIIILIDGTKLNIKNYNNDENKLIIKKIRFLIQSYDELRSKYNRQYDDKVLFIQKQINNLILQLK